MSGLSVFCQNSPIDMTCHACYNGLAIAVMAKENNVTSALATLSRSLSATFGMGRGSDGLADERRRDHAAMAKARRLAAKHGITIESDGRCRNGNFWVTYAPLMDDAADPLNGDHFCTSGHEVLDAVQVYAKHLTGAA
jgi:hypothetical protein